MNEIDKLYENAGVEKDCRTYKNYFECPFKQTQCEQCENYDYPPFTAEKQINLIKELIQKNFYDERIIRSKRIIRSNFEQTYFYCTYIDDYGDYCESEYFEKFEEALANVFNYFWQFLTEEERRRIKDILQ